MKVFVYGGTLHGQLYSIEDFKLLTLATGEKATVNVYGYKDDSFRFGLDLIVVEGREPNPSQINEFLKSVGINLKVFSNVELDRLA